MTRTIHNLGRALGATLVCFGAILPLPLARAAEQVTEIESDRVPKTVTGGSVFIQNGTLLTVTSGTIENGSILIRDGKIIDIGKNLIAPDDVSIIDASGRYVMPGIVDAHSHIAIEGGVNEGTLSITAEVRIGDVVNGRSVSIYRALAGGKTTANLLHGSANTIGGQNAVVRMKYNHPASDLHFPGAPRGIKFALGENVKQSNFAQNRGKRFPNSRIGVEGTLRRAFAEANEYTRRWEAYAKDRAAGRNVPEPRRDLRLETLAGVISGDVLVHCHCYRADEILMLLRVAEDFGFRIRSLQHVLEGYKIAPEIAAHGAGPSTFSDWWAYKMEAYDATPYNTALMTEAGCRVSINSDSSELDRHLAMEAAKTMRYGGMSESDALATITLNAAWQLGIDDKVGSLTPGKDADIAIFNGHPFSVYSYPVMTLIEGEVYFERDEPMRSDGPGLDFTSVAQKEHAPAPAISKTGTYAIQNATLYPITHPPIQTGTLVIRNGRIAAVGKTGDIAVPDGALVIPGDGLQVYPGFIDSGTTVGLTEIGSVAGTQDARELGNFQPDLRAIAAVNASSAHIPVTRANGTTAVITAPSGGLISGQAALLRLDGWTPAQMSIQDEAALSINFPGQSSGRRRRRSRPDSSADQGKRLTQLEDAFKTAIVYGETKDKAKEAGLPLPSFDPQHEAMLPYALGQKPVLLNVNQRAAIKSALEFGEKMKLKVILVGCLEGWKVADLLAEKKAAVIVGPVLSVPRESFDPYDSAYYNAAKLHEAGVSFALRTGDSSNARNLPFHAGTAVAFGLPRDVALEAITIRPARMFGVENEIGSLDIGKSADIIVSSGDPFEITSQIRHTFIQGRPVDLSTRHTKLYDQFRARLVEGKTPTASSETPRSQSRAGDDD